MSQPQTPNDQNDVLVESVSGTRYLILNRPKALNSLTTEMLEVIAKNLQQWESSSECKNIIVKSSFPKAFCAGGDVVHLIKENKTNDLNGILFFVDEYAVNHLMAVVKKPVVAIIQGITMGGGVGASVHFPFRVATENSLLAMPETLIGLFPDVGATFILPRLGSELGTYLGLTGTRLKGKDVFYSGFATHYVLSKNLPALEKKLASAATDSWEETNSILEQFVEKEQGDYKTSIQYSLAPLLGAIDRCFGHNTLEEIFGALGNETEQRAWAQGTLKTLKQMSPSSLKVTLEAFRRGKHMTIKQCLDMEAQIAAKIIQTNDFREGVSALLITKTKDPKFKPETIYKVDQAKLVHNYFVDTDPKFNPNYRSGIDFYEYPHKKYTLPNEADVAKYINKQSAEALSRPNTKVQISRELVVEHFDKLYKCKAGVKEKVWNILSRIPANQTGLTQLNIAAKNSSKL